MHTCPYVFLVIVSTFMIFKLHMQKLWFCSSNAVVVKKLPYADRGPNSQPNSPARHHISNTWVIYKFWYLLSLCYLYEFVGFLEFLPTYLFCCYKIHNVISRRLKVLHVISSWCIPLCFLHSLIQVLIFTSTPTCIYIIVFYFLDH